MPKKKATKAKISKQASALAPQLREYLSEIGRKGGKARLQTMTAAERRAVAKKAVAAREAKRRKKKESR